jgi:parallel beta-helix repeat protein
MGLVAERTENISLNQFNVMLKPSSGRMLTTTADATHFNNCRGLVRMSNCIFENMLDDGTNIHGVFTIVEDVLDEKTLGIKMGHFQQLGYLFASPGDKIGFIKPGGSLHPYAEAEVESVNVINRVYYTIKFKEKLDPGIKMGFLLDNLDWYPEVELVNNIVRNNRARGFLVRSPRNCICEGNYFSSMDQAISIHAGIEGIWYESGFVGEMIIRDNYFADGVYAGRERAIIDFGTEDSDDPYVFKKIIIENNEFKTFDPLIMNPERVDTLIIRNNLISKSDTYPPLFKDNPLIKISRVNYSLVSGNSIKDYDKDDISVDKFSEPNFHMENNQWENE